MLDNWARRMVDPVLRRAGRVSVRLGLGANGVTFAGLAFGLGSALGIALGGPPWLVLVLFALGRFCDGLDGTIARMTTPTDRGGFLDIVCDFAFYGAVPLAFALREPEFALPAAALLFSFYVNGATFLAFAAIAAKRRMESTVRGPKAIHFTAGLAEGTETIVVFLLMILQPAWFPALAYGFAALCIITAVARIALAWQAFSVDKPRAPVGDGPPSA